MGMCLHPYLGKFASLLANEQLFVFFGTLDRALAPT
jgi:hypothetical protein